MSTSKELVETQKSIKKYCSTVLVGSIMQKNAAILTIICLMMCLTINYTFPLQRSKPDFKQSSYPNRTIVERSKKMANNIEQVLKRFKDSTSGFGKNIYDHVSNGIKEHISFVNEEDLRQYEQMVIMKKYPYLDLKELELKFSPSKNIRQSEKLERGSNYGNEPGLCEPMVEDSPNVEIINRGLSGFAIPPELSKHISNIVENKVRTNSNSNKREYTYDNTLGSLKNDIKEYVEKINNKL